MESAGNDTIRGIQKTLEPYIRPREEVTRIRQILAAHLDSCLGDGDASGPLALADATSIAPSKAARGLQKEYLDALGANIRARAEFAACCKEQGRFDEDDAGPKTSGDQGADRLQEHLAVLRLRQRREKLQVIERGLNSLEQKPAASPGFLDPAEIFRDSRPLPSVPRELLTALTIDKAAAGPDLRDLIDQLERHVLQTKLLLRREEQLLETVKARSTARPETISERAKLDALDTTRVELINWMETELGKAGGDDADADGPDAHKHRALAAAAAGSVNMEEQLASIKEKYTQYLDARKTLLQLVSQQPQPIIKPPTRQTAPPPPPTPIPQPTAHLLAPSLSRLLLLAHEQKSQIAQKSHLTASLTTQLRETNKLLSHLSDESQLVPSHPIPGGPAGRSNAAAFAEATSSGIDGPSARVRPWVFAADSAKIATLEAVAEKIEEGQVALEGSMRTLGEIGELLGDPGDGQNKDGTGEEEDVWLAEGAQPEGRTVGGRRQTLRQREKAVVQVRTVWDLLDGGLGLIGGEKEMV
ncbi:hypothetical protein C8A05DRAFT_44155 [Staphylotrichum tortipilum]|uniref:Uncharacterized protein n=1 Tax=Staphylotrichum tortipilum TaxID=2831512 RepID=A0AAN6MLH0_9PEZI|nr:hypothetical protein C8A05DRAFT_44155 [Staphylotrichum longicolle]